MKRWLGGLLLSVVLGAGCSKPVEAPRDPYVFEPVRIALAYAALLEKPDAARALCLGEEAAALRPYLERAGVRVLTRAEGRVDLLVVSCDEMTPSSCQRAAALLTDNGVLMWCLDVRGVTMQTFRRRVSAFTFAQAHLWMPGENRWALVGRKAPRTIKLGSLLELFTRERAFADLAKARASTLPEFFANYVGDLKAALPKPEAGDARTEVRPEFFLTREILPFDWITPEGADADIAQSVMHELRSVQVIRRLAVEGSLLAQAAKNKKDEEAATDKWNAALKRNPNELLVLERLDRLERNAQGFLKVGRVLQAMKCYETMLLIRPAAKAAHNFGVCLKKIGKLDLAEKVLQRARELEKAEAENAENSAR